MKFILVIIFYSNWGGPATPTTSMAEFENLRACETALAEVGRRAPARSQWTAFCQPKGVPKVLKKAPEENSR